MIIEIDDRSPLPPYEQLRSQLVAMVKAGDLTEGTRLPSIRQLANDLGVAGGTVARAYRELESAGIVHTRGRHGTVVAPPPAGVTTTPEELVSVARAFVDRIEAIGVDVDEAIAVIRFVASRPPVADRPGAH